MSATAKRWPKFVVVYTGSEIKRAMGITDRALTFDLLSAAKGNALLRLAKMVHPKFVDTLQRVIVDTCTSCSMQATRRLVFASAGQHQYGCLADDWNEAARQCGYTELLDYVSGEPMVA